MKLSEFPCVGSPVPDRAERVAAGAADGRCAEVPPGAHVAYLVNVYPKISHSFIQTEINALERLGLTVSRFTIRRSPEGADSANDAEAEKTVALLDGNLSGLGGAVLRTALRRPVVSLRTLRRSLGSTRNLLRALAYFAEAAGLAEQLERRGIRHIHVHFGTNPVAVARLASWLGPFTYSFTAHGPDEFDAPLTLDLPGKIADARFVAGVSSFGRSQLMRWSDPVHWDRIQVVRCAVAPHFLSEDQEVAPSLATTRFTCVARLSAQKGLPLLIEAAARVAPSHAFTIDVIGDGEGRAVLEGMIDRLGLQDHIRLLGWQSPQDVRKALSHSRALILPSFAEGLPVVLMEALALGRPVIATAIAGVPELVDAENGWLIPSGSVDALAQAIQAALATPADELNAMGDVGRLRVRSLHTPEVNARHLASLLAPFL